MIVPLSDTALVCHLFPANSTDCKARKEGNIIVRNNRGEDTNTALSAMTRKVKKPS
jgi:hypothetical protein